MNTNIKILEEEFSSLIEDSKILCKKMEREKERKSLNEYYLINDGIEQINEALNGHMKETLTYYLKKHNIITKMNYMFKEQHKIDSRKLNLSYEKNKQEKLCNIEYDGENFQFIKPSLKDCLKLILDEKHFLFSLLYVFYSNKEKKYHFQESVILNMLVKKIKL